MLKQRKKLLLIYNPCSGKGGIIRALPDIIAIFTADGYDVTAHPTARQLDGQEFIAQYGAEYDLVVGCGGDGTLHELFRGLVPHKDLKCGYIPAGTVNDFASSLNIPRVMTQAADLIVRGNFRKIDVGLLNGERFAYVAAFGAFSEVSYSTDRGLKNVFGAFAYFLEGVKLFDLRYFSEKSRRLKITSGSDVYEGDFVFGMVGNTLSVAGMTRLLPDGASMEDGMLDCLFFRTPKNIADLDKIRAEVYGSAECGTNVIRLRTDRLIVESSEDIDWDADGEFGGSFSRAEIAVQPAAINIAATPPIARA